MTGRQFKMKRPVAFVLTCWWLGGFSWLMATPIARFVTGYTGPLSLTARGFVYARVIYQFVLVVFLVGLARMKTGYIRLGAVIAALWGLWLAVRIPWLAVNMASLET